MLFGVYLHSLIILLAFIPKLSESAYAGYTTKRHRGKILMMLMEVLKHVQMKMKAVHFINRMYYQVIDYQMGQTVYKIRKNFRRMVFLFLFSESRNKTSCIRNLAEVQKIQLETDKMLHMIEMFEAEKSKISEAHERNKFVLRNKADGLKYQEKEENKRNLRKQMLKIGKTEIQKQKKQRHALEEGFDTDR